jgi:hypothetical protein
MKESKEDTVAGWFLSIFIVLFLVFVSWLCIAALYNYSCQVQLFECVKK